MIKQIRQTYEFGPFRLIPKERQLLRDNQSVPLTPKSFDLLVVLVENCGHLIEKGELMKRIWPDSFVEEANLSVKISALRRALGEGPNDRQYVETVPRRGYRFVARVKERWDRGTESSTHESIEAGNDSRAEARELNADASHANSVVRSDERVRIAVQLVHAATGRNLWANSYESDLRDVLTLQREVTRDIVGEIRTRLIPQDHAQFRNVHQVNPEAYDHYLRGQFYLHRQNRHDNEIAITALERAVATDPTFAAAHAELAQAYVWKLFLFAPGERQWEEKAFVAVEKALALDPELAVAHLARGRLLWTPANRFPHDKAIREYRRALRLNPSLDEARNQLALVYSHIGAFDEALQESHKAMTINPNNNLAHFRIGETLVYQGKYYEALSVLRTIPEEVNPAMVGHQIAWALFNLRRKEEATATLEQLTRDYPEDSGGLFAGVQAVLAASAGEKRTAEYKIKSAVDKGKGFGHFHHTAYYIACAYALMNIPAQAIKWLEVTAETGFPCYPLFERDNNLDNIRQDVSFAAILAKLKQQWEYYRSIL